MPLSRSTRWVLAALIALLVVAHVAISVAASGLGLGGQGGGAFLLASVIEHPRVVGLVAAQLGVIVGLHALLIVVLVLLARPRKAGARGWTGGPSLMVLTWGAAWWGLLRLHATAFPHSAWTWHLLPVLDAQAAPVLDLLAAGFLGWRAVEVVRAAWRAWTSRSPAVPGRGSAWSLGIAMLAVAGVATALIVRDGQVAPPAGSDGTPRNVIVIGLDSFRRDVMLLPGPEPLPNLQALRERSFVNANVVTPLARTFPAWVTILTGLPPDASGARDNHAPQAGIHRDASVAFDFRRAGYRTIYATDETRFSHIVPAFGFDRVVSPQMGVPDFVLGQFGDQPLVNFFVQVPFAEWLLPALVGNRAFAQAYEPGRFIGRLRRAIGRYDGRPTFLAIHLCTAHYPFSIARSAGAAPGVSPSDAPYYAMLGAVDRQFGELRAMLEEAGYWDPHTLVLVLADHGEGLPSDGADAKVEWANGAAPAIQGLSGGHGASLQAPSQWKVFTLIAGESRFGPIIPGEARGLASLADIAPTLRRLAGVGAPEDTARDGLPPEAMNARPFVRLETGWRPRGLDLLNPDGKAALQIASRSYDVLSDGRIEMKPEVYVVASRDKDFGVTDGEHALVSMLVGERRILASLDPVAKRWTGFAVTGEVPATVRGPLLAAACAWPDFRSHLDAWCGERTGDPAPSEAAPPHS